MTAVDHQAFTDDFMAFDNNVGIFNWYRELGTTPNPLALATRRRCRMVVTDVHQWQVMQQAKDLDPTQAWLGYLDMYTTRKYHTSAQGEAPGCAGQYLDMDPTWFELDGAGSAEANRIQWADFNQHYLMTIADSNYVERCYDNAYRIGTDYGWDGFYFDNGLYKSYLHLMSTHFGAFNYPTHCATAWDTDAEVFARTQGWIDAVVTQLRADGFIVTGNVTGARDVQPTLGTHLVSTLVNSSRFHGGHQEFGFRFDTGYGTGYQIPQYNIDKDFRSQVAEIEDAEANGGFMFVTIPTNLSVPDSSARRWGAYCFLLGNNGKSMLCYQDDRGQGPDTGLRWLGAPLAPRVNFSGAVWTRDFEGGIIIGNAGTTTPSDHSQPVQGPTVTDIDLNDNFHYQGAVITSFPSLIAGQVEFLRRAA